MTRSQQQHAVRAGRKGIARLQQAETMAKDLVPRTPSGKRYWGDLVDLIASAREDFELIVRILTPDP